MSLAKHAQAVTLALEQRASRSSFRCWLSTDSTMQCLVTAAPRGDGLWTLPHHQCFQCSSSTSRVARASSLREYNWDKREQEAAYAALTWTHKCHATHTTASRASHACIVCGSRSSNTSASHCVWQRQVDALARAVTSERVEQSLGAASIRKP